MKIRILTGMTVVLVLLFSCNKDRDETGKLIFKGVKVMPALKSVYVGTEKNSTAASVTHVMHTANLKLDIADIWVSQGLVSENIADDFEWHKIGEGNGMKAVEEILFTADDLPVGDYQSIKINFRNSIVRVAVYQSNISKTVEMSGSLDEESCGDGSIITQYFSKRGNHSLQNGSFHLDAEGEYIRGFKVKPGETTTVYWKLGGINSKLTDCTFDWIDANGNGSWDCGLDQTANFNCTVSGPMWTFGVDDGEVSPFIVGAVSDIDGNTYNAIKIGNQIWMAENLKTTRLNDGPSLMTREQYQKYLEENPPAPPPTPMPPDPPLRAIQNNDPNLFPVYGSLYSYTTVATGKLCPSGWHVPSDAEWTTLTNYLGKNAGGKLKATRLWHPPNQGATDETEFSALPGGAMIMVSGVHRYTGYGQEGYWWTSSNGSARIMTFSSGDVNQVSYHTTGAGGEDTFLSCRCVKD